VSDASQRTLAAQGELQKAVATVFFTALPRRGWASARLFWSSVPGVSYRTYTVRDVAGERLKTMLRLRGIDDQLSALKAAMADPQKGTWLSTELTVTSDGRFSFAYNYDRRVYWHQDDAYVPAAEPYPEDRSWVEEFAAFPRAGDYLPDWLPTLPPADHDQDRIDAIMAIPTPVPAELQPLAEQWGWPDLFEGVEDAFGRWLGTEPYRSLLDEVSRRDSDRVADGLIQDVIADVMASYVDPRPAKDVVRLWRSLADLRGLAEPDGLDQLNPEAPIDKASETAIQLRGDIMEALDAVVDAKIATRFP
jgi:hypothetical protein